MEFRVETKKALGRKISAAAARSEDSDERSALFNEFMGEPYGDEAEDESVFVSSDISDAIESTMPDIMDVFTSADRVGEFAPVGPEDEEWAEQETDVTHHVFWKMNAGFLILYTMIKEALTQQNSYTKQGWVEKERVEIEKYADLTVQDLLAILGDKQDADYEVLEQSGFEVVEVVDQMTGQPQQQIAPLMGDNGQPEPISIKLRCVTVEKKYEICNIPQEDFFLSDRWHSIDLTGIPVCGHRRKMEVGELVAMGFDETILKELADEDEDVQTDDRHDTKDSQDEGEVDDNEWGATRLVTVYQSYVRQDINDDGKAELCEVWAAGDGTKILKWKDGNDAIEEVSDHPFSSITPFPVPHRHAGRSLAELIRDVQRVKTVMLRHAFTSVYNTNHVRPMFDDTQNLEAAEQLYADLLDPKPGSPIRTGGIAVEWSKPQSVVPDILPILSMMDDLGEKRTGSVRYSQGMASEALNNAAASTVAQVRDWVTMRKMLIARIFAETGLKDIFLRIHKDMRSGPHREMVMQLRNKWVSVNPRQWKARTDLTVTVGAGTGDRDEQRQGYMLMGQVQREAMAAQMPGIGPEQVRHTTEKMAATYGIEDITPFWADPAQIPPQPEQPDPRQQAFKAQMAAEQKKRDDDFKLKKYEIDLKHQIERGKLGLAEVKVVMEDDRIRDVEELKAASGFQRDKPMSRDLAPPIPYGQVMGGQR